MTLKRQKIESKFIPPSARAKWGVEVLDEGFVPFPKKFLRCLSQVLGTAEYERLQVLLALVDYLRDEMKNPPSLQYLAFVAGLDEDVFRRHLNQLAEAGLVDVSGQEATLMYSVVGLKNAINKEAEKLDL